MHPDLTLAVASDRHRRRTDAVEARGRATDRDQVAAPPVPVLRAPARAPVLRLVVSNPSGPPRPLPAA
jgi:hypothetical protein